MPICPEPSVAVEIAKVTIPALIVIAGWYVAHVLTAGRERRSEVRKRAVDRCDNLLEEVIKTRELANSYHASERVATTELDIVARFADLSLALPFLRQLGANDSDLHQCAHQLLQFKQASTLTHFEADHISALIPGDEQLMEIARTASSLLRSLRACQTHLLTK